MKKIYALFVVLAVLCGVAEAGVPDVALHQKCIYPTVFVSDNDTGGHGSGVIVRSELCKDGSYSNYALTCTHVTDGIKNIVVYTQKYKNWSTPIPESREGHDAIVYVQDEASDIAIIAFKSKEKLPVAEVDIDPKLYIGNDIISSGCALRTSPRVAFGKVTDISDKIMNADVLTIPGDSGGPVYHNYKLVALKHAIRIMSMKGAPYPLFNHSKNVMLKQLVDMDKKREVSFVYNTKETLPKLPFILLEGKKHHQFANPKIEFFLFN